MSIGLCSWVPCILNSSLRSYSCLDVDHAIPSGIFCGPRLTLVLSVRPWRGLSRLGYHPSNIVRLPAGQFHKSFIAQSLVQRRTTTKQHIGGVREPADTFSNSKPTSQKLSTSLLFCLPSLLSYCSFFKYLWSAKTSVTISSTPWFGSTSCCSQH